jgi:hypothetical protein
MNPSDEEILRALIRETMIFDPDQFLLKNTANSFYKIEPHIFERKYVTKVLGINLPLNESYPYSAPVYNKIIKEQKLLEDFFNVTDQQIKLLIENDDDEDESNWSWGAALRFSGDVKAAAGAMKVMATNPDTIDTFVQAVIDIVKEQYEKIKKFTQTVYEKSKEWGVAILEKLGEFSGKVWSWIEAAFDKANSMDGWKKALAIGGAVVGLKWFWDKYGGGIEEAIGKFNIFSKLYDQAKKFKPKNESVLIIPTLSSALYGSGDPLTELFGKNWEKEAEKAENDPDYGTEKEKEGKDDKKEKVGGAADKAEEKSEKAGEWWSQFSDELPDDIKEKGQELIDWFQKKIMKGIFGAAKKKLASLATDAVGAAATGGFAEFLKGAGKAFGGASFALKTLRPALSATIDDGKVKEQAKEAGGEEEFWEEGTDENLSDSKDKKDKKNESIIRMIIRESLLIEGIEFHEVDSPLHYNRAGNVKRLALCDTAVEDRHLRPDGNPQRDTYFNDQDEWTSYGNSGRRLKKPRKTGIIPGVADACVIGFLDYHKDYDKSDGSTAWYIDYMKTRGDKGGQGTASKLVDEFFSRVASDGDTVHFGKMMSPAIGHLKDKMEKQYPDMDVMGAVNYR